MFSRLLTLLQFTRLALVFTAVSNGWAALILQAAARRRGGESVATHFDPKAAVAMTGVSIGLYAFGMALNDIIDRRRDSTIAAHRPLPSGKLGVRTAYAVCGVLLILAFGCAAYLARALPGGQLSFALMLATLGGIVFYDFAGKYLVGPGLLALGLIRGLQASIAAPDLPVVWHPLLLVVHVTLLSTLCYAWEGKRPRISRRNLLIVLGGLLVVVAGAVAYVVYQRALSNQGQPARRLIEVLAWRPELIYPCLAVAGFGALLAWIKHTSPDPRAAGRRAMLYGLLWLILYDAGFVFAYVGPLPAAVVLLLLPVAFLSVRVMRWWATVADVTQKPQYQRAG